MSGGHWKKSSLCTTAFRPNTSKATVVFLMEPEWFWKADFTLVTSELSVSAIFYLGETNLFKFV